MPDFIAMCVPLILGTLKEASRIANEQSAGKCSLGTD